MSSSPSDWERLNIVDQLLTTADVIARNITSV